MYPLINLGRLPGKDLDGLEQETTILVSNPSIHGGAVNAEVLIPYNCRSNDDKLNSCHLGH